MSKQVDLLEDLGRESLRVNEENTLARVAALVKSIDNRRFDGDDCFELKEVLHNAIDEIIDNLDNNDFDDLLKAIVSLGGNSRRRVDIRDIERSSRRNKSKSSVKDFDKVANAFDAFLSDNTYGKISTYDRFKPVFEKFIQVYPDYDGLVVGKLNEFYQYWSTEK